MKNSFKILSIDGGGFRGVYAAHILKRMEEEFAVDWTNDFNLIAGTSTGAIIAAGLVCGKSASDILDIYKDRGKKIFKKRWYTRWGILGSKYNNNQLKEILFDVFGDKKLGEIRTPLILPASNVGNGHVHVFKSQYDDGFIRDKNVFVHDAVLASCSAPTYFNPFQVQEYLLADGGLWANSPSLIAVIDARKRLKVDLTDMKIMSIGTGINRPFYSWSKNKIRFGWGIMTRWGGSKFVDMLMNLQSDTANNMVKLLLKQEQILRINFEMKVNVGLDDPCKYDLLKSQADHDFTHNSANIRKFLKITEVKNVKRTPKAIK